MIELELPYPPSVNTYWRTPREGKLAGRTMLSAKARSFREACIRRVIAISPQKAIQGRLRVWIVANPPDRRKRDLDNITKAVLDALQHCGVIEDDGNIDDLRVTRGIVRRDGSVMVQIAEAS